MSREQYITKLSLEAGEDGVGSKAYSTILELVNYRVPNASDAAVQAFVEHTIPGLVRRATGVTRRDGAYAALVTLQSAPNSAVAEAAATAFVGQIIPELARLASLWGPFSYAFFKLLELQRSPASAVADAASAAFVDRVIPSLEEQLRFTTAADVYDGLEILERSQTPGVADAASAALSRLRRDAPAYFRVSQTGL